MKIGNFNISKKILIIIVVIVGILAVLIIGQSIAEQKEFEDRLAAEELAIQQVQNQQNNQQTDVLDYDEQLQASLREEFGEPPEGFIWDVTGNLVAVGTDELNAEQILYTYIRALSILDFSTAQKYSAKSYTTEAYQEYYSDTTAAITDYYDNFLRQQFKESLTTIEIIGVKDTAVFADGTQYVTVTVSALDLSDKDFWLADKDKLFKDMRVFDETEDDDVKMEKYVYEYVKDSYKDGSVSKKEYDIEFVVSKENSSGWLVSNDKELCSILTYESGVDVARYIIDSYYDWYVEIIDDEISEQEGNNDYTEDSTEGLEEVESTEGF